MELENIWTQEPHGKQVICFIHMILFSFKYIQWMIYNVSPHNTITCVSCVWYSRIINALKKIHIATEKKTLIIIHYVIYKSFLLK